MLSNADLTFLRLKLAGAGSLLETAFTPVTHQRHVSLSVTHGSLKTCAGGRAASSCRGSRYVHSSGCCALPAERHKLAFFLQVHDLVMAAILAAEPELHTSARMNVPHRTSCFEVTLSLNMLQHVSLPV